MDMLESLTLVLGYTRDNYLPCWVIHTPPASGICGFSARLVSIGTDGYVTLERANGDLFTAPLSEVSIRTRKA